MDDLVRLRNEYARRARDPRYRDWYSIFNPANVFLTQERDREIGRLLSKALGSNLNSSRVLDLGCGGGRELAKFFFDYGGNPENLWGIDLLWDNVFTAREKYSMLHFACGNAEKLPFGDCVFDLVVQFTVLTSILDDELRHRITAEMLRVLKLHGFVLWYDFRWNPTNPQTHGIEKAEIKNLFPNCEFVFRRLTLAPPLARVIAPRSWFLCTMLSLFSPLKTHYLAMIRKGEPLTKSSLLTPVAS